MLCHQPEIFSWIDHPDITLGLVVREPNVEVGGEAQHAVALAVEPSEQVGRLLGVTRALAHLGGGVGGPTPSARTFRGGHGSSGPVANSMLFTIRHLLTTGASYGGLGAACFERRHDPAVEAKRPARRIEALGIDVDLAQEAA
ncbi:MAG: hypothetical protein ACYCVN_02585 [Acidimicrobiales bacterium]